MYSIASIQRRQRPLFFWVITLALLASQVLSASHYHFSNHISSDTDAALHTIDLSNLQYALLAEKLKDQQEPHNHSHDESTCDLCYFASLSLSVSNEQLMLGTPQAHSIITNTSSVFTVHSSWKDSLPRAPPPALSVA